MKLRVHLVGIAIMMPAIASAQPAPDVPNVPEDEPLHPVDTLPPLGDTAAVPPVPIIAEDHVVVMPAKPAVKSDDEDEGVPRLSLPTEADRVAWRRSGFRLGLGLLWGKFEGLRGAPSGRLLGPNLRVGLRLDEDWSLMAQFVYASASQQGGLSGLRFAGTIDPTWHATRSLSIAVGFGFAGIVEGRTGRMDPEPLADTLDATYTFPDARTPIARCSGVGAAGLARLEWAYVLGPRSQTNVSFEVLGQWTACVDGGTTHRVEPDTGEQIVRRQFWPHAGATIAWGITWR
jgi:hypothetical protein